MTVPFGGELHTAADIDVTLVGEFVLVIHIAEYGVGNTRMYSLQRVFFVVRGIRPELSTNGDGDDRDMFGCCRRSIAAHLTQFPPPDRFGIGARHHRRFEESVRVEPHVELPDLRILGPCGPGSVAGSIDMPAIVPVDHEYLMGVLLH